MAAYGNLLAAALSPAGYNEATTLAAMRGLVRFFRLDAQGNLEQLVDVPVGCLPDSPPIPMRTRWTPRVRLASSTSRAPST